MKIKGISYHAVMRTPNRRFGLNWIGQIWAATQRPDRATHLVTPPPCISASCLLLSPLWDMRTHVRQESRPNFNMAVSGVYMTPSAAKLSLKDICTDPYSLCRSRHDPREMRKIKCSTMRLYTVLIVLMATIAGAQNTTVDLFLPTAYDSNVAFGASIIGVCSDQTVYDLQCTRGMFASTITCDSHGPVSTSENALYFSIL